jgi:periplasmic protein CpxP/Spy
MKLAVFTLAAALFAAAAPAQAQQQDGQRRPQARAERMDPKQRIERRVERLDEKLNLSDDQAARIRTILTQESEQMRAHFQKTGRARAEGAQGQRAEGQRPSPAARDSMRAQMKQARERTDAAILQVLNADQRAQYEKLQQEMRERGPRGEKRDGEKRGERRGSRA